MFFCESMLKVLSWRRSSCAKNVNDTFLLESLGIVWAQDSTVESFF